MKQETRTNNKETKDADEIIVLIDEFLKKHIKVAVSQVKLLKQFKKNENCCFQSKHFLHLQSTHESDEDCLLYYSKQWSNYQWSANVLNNVCRYLNNKRVKRSENTITVEKMAFRIWREHVFNHLNEKVSNAALEMIERNRNGDIINTSAIKDVIESYIELGRIYIKKDPRDFKGTKDIADELKVKILDFIFH